MSKGKALLWGTVIVAVALGALAAAYFQFCAWLNRLPAIPISHQQAGISFPEHPSLWDRLGMLVRLIHQALNGM